MRFESSNVQLEAAQKLQAEARAAYRKGNLKLAINKFTEAIDMKPPILMTLLDGRSATYEKAEQLKPALNDAKMMMKHEKTSPKGYLRAGKILHLMDKTAVAIDIYKLGLKHVAASDPHIDLLKGMLDKAVEKQNKAIQVAAKNRYDPMQVLPLELLEMIMEYVPFSNLVAMQRVSKTWLSVISNNPRFWTVLDFSRAKKPVGRNALKNCISKSKYSLTKAVINRIQGFNDTTLIDMVTVCKDLEYLKLMDGFFGSSLTRAMQLTKGLKILILHCLIPFTTLETLFNPETGLEHLECWQLGPNKDRPTAWGEKEPCLSFKRVLINYAAAEEREPSHLVPLEQFATLFPNLIELQVNKIFCSTKTLDMTPLEKLEVFSCRNSKITSDDIMYPESLRILDLSSTSFTHTNTAIHQETLLNLERLNLTKSNLTTDTLIELVPQVDAKLTHLRIGWCRNIGFQNLVDHYFKNSILTTIKELSVEGDYDFSNRSMQSLYYLPVLKRLDCSSTSVKGAGAYQLISNRKSNSLEEIVMNGVDRVSEDLVKFASEKGIRIIQHQEGGKAWQLLQGENLNPFMKIWN